MECACPCSFNASVLGECDVGAGFVDPMWRVTIAGYGCLGVVADLVIAEVADVGLGVVWAWVCFYISC